VGCEQLWCPCLRQTATLRILGPTDAVREMVPNATKLESKFPRETAAVAGRSAFGGTLREFHENTPELLNDLLQLLRFQCLGWRVVNSAALWPSQSE